MFWIVFHEIQVPWEAAFYTPQWVLCSCYLQGQCSATKTFRGYDSHPHLCGSSCSLRSYCWHYSLISSWPISSWLRNQARDFCWFFKCFKYNKFPTELEIYLYLLNYMSAAFFCIKRLQMLWIWFSCSCILPYIEILKLVLVIWLVDNHWFSCGFGHVQKNGDRLRAW